MHFSQIWPPSPILGAIFGFGYVLGHFGGQICRFWFRLNFSNFFRLFCNKIVKLGTFFNNLAKMAKKMQKLAQNGSGQKLIFWKKHILWFGSSSQKIGILGEWKWWNMIGRGFPFLVPKGTFWTPRAHDWRMAMAETTSDQLPICLRIKEYLFTDILRNSRRHLTDVKYVGILWDTLLILWGIVEGTILI